MAAECQTEQIVDFALVPVRARPDTCNGRDLGMLFSALTNLYFQANEALVGQREKLVDDIEAGRALGPIDCGDGFKEVVLQVLFQEGADGNQMFRLEND